MYWAGWFDELGPNAVPLAALEGNGEQALAVINPRVLSELSGSVLLCTDSSFIRDEVLLPEHVALILNAIEFSRNSIRKRLKINQTVVTQGSVKLVFEGLLNGFRYSAETSPSLNETPWEVIETFTAESTRRILSAPFNKEDDQAYYRIRQH